MPAVVEVALVDLRRKHPGWGPRRLVYELAKVGVEPVPSESGVYRALLRFGLIDPAAKRPRDRKWKRWERGRAMELWQMDVVGGFLLADQLLRTQLWQGAGEGSAPPSPVGGLQRRRG